MTLCMKNEKNVDDEKLTEGTCRAELKTNGGWIYLGTI